jgi:hypothetical protein
LFFLGGFFWQVVDRARGGEMGKMPKAKRRGGEEVGPATTVAAASGNVAPKAGIVFNKDFGQHILKNPLVVQGIV